MTSSLVERLFVAAGVASVTGKSALLMDELLRKHVTPAIETDWPEHVARIVDREELAEDPFVALSGLELADVALALAAVKGDAEAVAKVETTIIEPLPRTLSRLSLTPETIDELRQDLREKLFVGASAKLREYRGRGPLGAWARMIALRLAYDRARSQAKDRATTAAIGGDDDALSDLVAGEDPPDIAALRARYSAELREAFAAAVKRLDAEQRAVLRSHAIDALTIDQIGALYQVHRATAARWVSQAKSALLGALREELARRLGEGHEACDSVVALVRSRIDLSLERALRD